MHELLDFKTNGEPVNTRKNFKKRKLMSFRNRISFALPVVLLGAGTGRR